MVIRLCCICSEIKPRYKKKTPQTLMEIMSHLRELNVDSKGIYISQPLHTNIGLTNICFLFSFPCADISTLTVRKKFPLFVFHFLKLSFYAFRSWNSFYISKCETIPAFSRPKYYTNYGFSFPINEQAERYNSII